MKLNFKFVLILSLFALMCFTSCQNEVLEETQNQEDTFVPDSVLAGLMRSTASNNGALDDIMDEANCFSVNLPVTIIANGITITIDSLEDLVILEEIFSEFENDTDILEFLFPITIILNDYTEITIDNQEELEAFIEECTNSEDDVIECVDFVYPISFSIYNSAFQIIDTVVIESDEALYDFLEELEDNPAGGAILASLNFPVTLIYSDGSTIEVNSNQELAAAINAADEECDNNEEDCNIDDVEMYLIECYWNIVSFNGDDNFIQYDIYFNEDGTLVIQTSPTSVAYGGHWEVSETDAGLILSLIELSAFDQDLGGDWLIIECDNDRFKLVRETGSAVQHVVLERECENEPPCSAQEVNNALVECIWYSGSNVTSNDFYGPWDFDSSGVVIVTTPDGTVVTGQWNITLTDAGVFLILELPAPYQELSGEWELYECGEHWYKFINGDHYVVFEGDCSDPYDCPDQQLNVGDECETANGLIGVINENCECVTDNTYDCPDQQLNVGDECETANGLIGVINENCECVTDNTYDCPDLQANVGDECETAAGLIGVLNENCECVTDNTFDCPDLQSNVGDECETAAGLIGVLNENCECVTDNTFDCPDYQANVGDPCENPNGVSGVLNENCDCVTDTSFDCPDLQANIGDVCEDANGNVGVINANCGCEVDTPNPFECFSAVELVICDDDIIDGFAAFNLEEAFPNCPTDEVEITFHASLSDAETDLAPLTSPYVNTSNPQTIYARVALAGNNSVYEVFEVHLFVENCNTDPCTAQAIESFLMECEWIPVSVDGSNDFNSVHLLFNPNNVLIAEGLGMVSTGNWIVTGNASSGVFLQIGGFNNVFQVLIGEWLVAQCSETEMVLINNANNNQVILQRECN